MTPQFLYFDMGNVLLPFSHERAAQQMAGVAGIDPRRAWEIVFSPEGLHWSYERGELTREQFHARFCEQTGRRPDIDALDHAGNDIFSLNIPIVGLLGGIAAAGHRLGVLSNTSVSHWRHCTARFAILTTLFRVHALSYQLGALKPDPRIFAAAEGLAKVPPASIFFTDDRPENVAAARAAGWDAVVYESVSSLNEELRQRGVIMNY